MRKEVIVSGMWQYVQRDIYIYIYKIWIKDVYLSFLLAGMVCRMTPVVAVGAV